MQIPSRILEEAISHFESLPGVGSRSALRYVLSMLRGSRKDMLAFSKSIERLAEEIKICETCHNISDSTECTICANPRRDKSTICVVQDIRDVMAIENTEQYSGSYHVLGGLISPMENIGPSELSVDSLIERVKNSEVKEIILALSATTEGDTTLFYIYKKIKEYPVKVSTIARGIAFGGELEYTDEVTLARSIATRIPYENLMSR